MNEELQALGFSALPAGSATRELAAAIVIFFVTFRSDAGFASPKFNLFARKITSPFLCGFFKNSHRKSLDRGEQPFCVWCKLRIFRKK